MVLLTNMVECSIYYVSSLNNQSASGATSWWSFRRTITRKRKVMSKKMLVTSNQTDAVRDMANAKGVTRVQFQMAQDDGRIARFLDNLKVDVNNVGFATLTPPPCALLHTVHIRFKPDREWQEAVNAAGPNTPGNYNVRNVGYQYPPVGTGEIEEDLILLNFPNSDGFDKARAWAQSKQLEDTDPREVFAVGGQYPRLHKRFEQNPMYVVATKECVFGGIRYACCVWWDDLEREVNLNWIRNFNSSLAWFAFRKPVRKT